MRHSARFVVDVHLLLVRGEQILLGERQNTGFADGAWHVPAGHLEADEDLASAIAREALEELGIVLDPARAELVHVMHHASGRLATFFVVRQWRGKVTNKEPEKCRGLAWHPVTELPDPSVDYLRVAVNEWLAGRPLSLYGWNDASIRAA
jgi:8-oxo-dGTP diphosphatase